MDGWNGEYMFGYGKQWAFKIEWNVRQNMKRPDSPFSVSSGKHIYGMGMYKVLIAYSVRFPVPISISKSPCKYK